MPALLNSAYERIARLLAKGMSPQEAYRKVRKCKYDKNITRFFKAHPEIFERASELEQLEATGQTLISRRAQEKAAVDRAYVLLGLKDIYERAVQARPVLDRHGNPVLVETKDGKLAAMYKYDAHAALKALHMLGLEIGMFVQRYAQVEDPFASLPAQTVQEIMQALEGLRRRALPQHEVVDVPVDHGPAIASSVDRDAVSTSD